MNDSRLERDINRALAVEPSPEFVARVRTRIAAEQTPTPHGFGWRFVGITATAAAAAVVALAVLRPNPRVEPAPLLISRALPNVERRTPNVEPQTPNVEPRTTHVEPRTTHVEPRTTHVARQTSNEERSEEALFDPRETMALQRLIAGVRSARVDLTPLLQEAPLALPADDLVIPPITIQPLALSDSEGERP